MNKGIYKHFKGNLYKVINVVKHSETLEEMVVYESLKNHSLWVRPKSMFLETVLCDKTEIPRFEYVKKVCVSSCLLGDNCKYNGKNNYNENVIKYLSDKEYVSVCPEVLGGLSIPRDSSEIKGASGNEVLKGFAKVVSNKNEDVTKEFLIGAKKALDIISDNNINVAILQPRSPSCGFNKIYDGSFSGKLKKGMGVTASLFSENGVKFIDLEDLK